MRYIFALYRHNLGFLYGHVLNLVAFVVAFFDFLLYLNICEDKNRNY